MRDDRQRLSPYEVRYCILYRGSTVNEPSMWRPYAKFEAQIDFAVDWRTTV